MHPLLSRKDFLRAVVAVTAATALPIKVRGQEKVVDDITIEDLKAAQELIGLKFTDDELKPLLTDVKDALKGFGDVRALPITYLAEPPTIFIPKSLRPVRGKPGVSVKTGPLARSRKPADLNDLAFYSVKELANLIKTKQISSIDLTELSLRRLQQYGDKLLCVVTLMADQARADAKKADDEIRAGKYRGPLHGIPCGVKDLFATIGAPTTWGAAPYQDQSFNYDAAVVEKLRAAGAIICAKFSMGALAQGDVWFKGKTKNPWNPARGSSGSSAGSASAVAACLVPFAIGTETLGSIMSPSNECRVTGLRPTYGRISRYGAMALSYTMDKVGPICREAEDCALVFAAISGAHHRDRSSVDKPFHYAPKVDWKGLRVGYLVAPNEEPGEQHLKQDYVQILQKLGAQLSPVKFESYPTSILTILEVESSSAFDEFTRSERIGLLKDSAWPQSFRGSRFVPGVEYLQAQRARSLLMDSFEKQFGDLDVVVCPGVGSYTLRYTNLTGHPQVLIPFGLNEQGNSRSVSFVGRIYEDDLLLAVANAFQQAGDWHTKHPDLSKL